jgi:hypothetical protein
MVGERSGGDFRKTLAETVIWQPRSQQRRETVRRFERTGISTLKCRGTFARIEHAPARPR